MGTPDPITEEINTLGDQLPWVKEFKQKFSGGIAHTFILHGAIDDYVGHIDRRPVKIDYFLSHILMQTRSVVCFYNYSQGIYFASPSMRRPFLEAAGLGSGAQENGERLLPDPRAALPALERALLHPGFKMALIVEDPELIWPEGDYGHLSGDDRMSLSTLRRWARGDDFINAEQVIILLTPTATDLHGSLRTASSLIEQIEIPYPSIEERERFINERLARSDKFVLQDGLTSRGFASLTGGLSRVLVDDICLRAAVEERPIDAGLIKDRKDQIIRDEFGELIEILEPTIGFDKVGGLEEVKQYLRSSVVAPLKDPALLSRMPSGVLLAGPPGTGKTLLVSALAYEAGVSVVKLNAGRLLGQYVGNSERNLEKALACIRSLVPTIVMIDEIEQQFQRGGASDSGVERRIFGRILEEMSGSAGDRRGDVIWFAATNRVDMVDPALRRPGRFDRIVPILPPDQKERWAILFTKLTPGTEITQEEGHKLLHATEHYTGADLDGVIIKASEIAFDNQRAAVTGADLLGALEVLRPSSGAQEIQEMITVALEHCNDLSLVPEAWRAEVKQAQAEQFEDSHPSE